MSFKHLEEGFFCYSVLLSQNIFIHLNISNKQIYIYIVYFRLILASNDILETRLRLCVPDESHSRRDGARLPFSQNVRFNRLKCKWYARIHGKFSGTSRWKTFGGFPLFRNGKMVRKLPYRSHKISNSAVRTGRKHQLFWPKIFPAFRVGDN